MVLLAPCFVYAVMAPAADIQPRTYKSESGEYAWEIDPSDPGAKGPAAYRVLKNGKEVWQGTHDLTLYDAVVDRRGILAGSLTHRAVMGEAGKRTTGASSSRW